MASVAVRTGRSAGSQLSRLCENCSFGNPATAMAIPMAARNTINLGRLVVRSATQSIKRSKAVTVFVSLLVFFFAFKGIIASTAGRRKRVKNRENNTPTAENNPRSAIGATSALAKDARPAAVVSDVITMANPECE